MVVLVVILFNFVRNIFRGDESTPQTARRVNLVEEARAGKPVRYTMYGVVNGQEIHRDIRITIGPGTRLIEVVQGYNGQVIKSEEFPNTSEAYRTFAAALNGAGYALSVGPEGRGIEDQSCPLGRRYAYEVAPDSNDISRTWSTSCATNQGTFGGNAQQVRSLFQRQIPDYEQFVRGIRLG